MRLAFIGFRHAHIMSLHDAAARDPRIEIVAACEEDPQAASDLRQQGRVNLTHDDCRRMLDEVECDAVGIGDYYDRRGRLIVEVLSRGRHVISDKPVCTSEAELAEITSLCRQYQLRLGCLLDLRSFAPFRTARRLIHEDAIGAVHTISFSAQHPLLYGRRPGWYFEPGKHGGTINDIAIHAFDAIPWMTRRALAGVIAARAWNARLPQHPQFQDAAQFMMMLDNDGGVLGDVSYLAPDGCGYAAPQYWRMTLHGEEGVLECGMSSVQLARHEDKAVRMMELDPAVDNAALEAFMLELAGEQASPSTHEVLRASGIALAVQRCADQGLRDVAL
jgi:predicted dehydrogenase